MTVGSAFTSQIDASPDTREPPASARTDFSGSAKNNHPRNAKDSQGTERPLRVLLLLFPQGKRRPRRRRGGKGKIRKEPPPPRRGGTKRVSTKKEEKSGAARRAADLSVGPLRRSGLTNLRPDPPDQRRRQPNRQNIRHRLDGGYPNIP